MFGYVPMEKYDAEHELRIRAEAAAEEARLVAHRLFATIENERIQHREEMKDLLERALPKPVPPVPGFGVPGMIPGHASYQEIMGTPAVGKRGVRERNAAARDAMAREKQEESETTLGKQRAVLLPEEQALIDKHLPI